MRQIKEEDVVKYYKGLMVIPLLMLGRFGTAHAIDFIAGYDCNATANTAWINDGKGNFTDTGQLIGSSRTRTVTLGDVDNDGDLDLVSGNSGVADRVWLNDY
ncbi:MAG: VCBS repeat-containing protein [Gammaproteobacteria bacterium]|nr:VCBS repeat-containing protein [Gammaproteobacteria bacterium]